MSIVNSYKKQFISLFGVVVLLLSLSALIVYEQVNSSLQKEFLSKLTLLKHTLSNYTEFYFDTLKKDILTISKDGILVENYTILKDIYRESNSSQLHKTFTEENPFDFTNRDRYFKSKVSSPYEDIHFQKHSYFKEINNRFDFYDIFLIDLDGNIVYSVKKEADFATNLVNGNFSHTEFAKGFKRALNLNREEIVFADFSQYIPSAGRPASFILTPIFKDEKVIGVFAVQISIEKLNNLMQLKDHDNRYGLGKSGEAYLVGEDLLMRSNSRFLHDINEKREKKIETTVGVIKVTSSSVKKAILGESGEAVIQDYRGVSVLSSYSPIKIFDRDWALIVEIDSNEVINIMNSMLQVVLFTIVLLVVVSLIIISYLFLKTVLKPIETNRDEISNSIKKKSRQLEHSLAFLEEYKRAVDQSSIVSKANRHGKITYINDAFSKISGYQKDELLGRSHSIVRHPDMPKEVFTDLWNTISHKRVWRGVIKNRRKDGGEYYVNSTIIPMLDEKGEIREYISIRNNITELIKKKQQLIRQTTDSLTKLPNREKLYQDIETESKKGSPLTLVIIRVNRFKEIIDFYGIESADQLALSVARTLQKIKLDDSNTTDLYRIGSDQFSVLFKKEPVESELNDWMDSVIRYFDHNFIATDQHSFNVEVTIGLSKGEDSKKLLFDSRMALGRASKSGKNYITFGELDEIKREYKHNINMTAKIKSAIAEDRIVIFTQQIFSNGADPIRKFEVLVRLEEENRVLSPYFFLDIAKRARLYTTITKIVVNKAFKEFKSRNDDFSINLTIEDIKDVGVVDYLKRKIIEYGVGDRLILEVVESEGIEQFDEVSTFINDVKRLGCRVAVDDFGTGYSNFEYLMKLNVDYIKIDGSLIKNIAEDNNSQIIVELIVQFAKEKGIKTVAEFVSNRDILQKVKELNVDYSQGFLLGEPKRV